MKKYLLLLTGIWLFCSPVSAQRFAWLTDVHYMRKSLGKDYLERMFKEIDSLHLDFVAITGDVVDIGYTENFAALQKILRQVKTPVYLTYGNHEGKWSGNAADKFKDYAGMDKFAFDYQGVKFVGFVSTMVLHNGSNIIPIQQYPWIDSVLNTVKPGQYVVAMTHFPMRGDVRNGDVVSEKFARHNVQVFLVGHGHKDKLTEPYGIPNLMSDEVYSNPYNIVTVKADGLDIYKKRVGGPETFWINMPFRSRPFDAAQFKRLNIDSINAVYPKVKCVWQKQLAYPVHGPAAIANQKVLFADQSAHVYALDVSSGKELWKQSLNGSCTAAPKVEGERVFIGTSSGEMYALSLNDGRILWKRALGGEIWTNAAVEKGVVYVQTSEFDFFALNAADGKVIWKASHLKSATPTGNLTDVENLLVMVPLDKKLYALNKLNGEFVWRGELNGGRSCPLADPILSPTHSERMFATPGRFVRIDLLTGKTLETDDKSDNLNTICFSADDQIYYYRSKKGGMKANSLTNRQKKAIWNVRLDTESNDEGSAPLLFDGGIIYFSTATGYAGAVDAESGSLLWRYKAGNAFINTPALYFAGKKAKGMVLTGNEGKISFLSFP